MGKVVHFEIPAEDMKRAEKFYTDVFGWIVNQMPEMNYTIFHTGPTDEKGMLQENAFINGGMMKREAELKNPIITIDVPDIDKALAKINSMGGQTVKTKMEVGDMGFTAYFKDSEGNIMGLWENKSS